MNILKSSQEIVAEIHEAFDSAEDRLIAEAEEIIKEQSNPPGQGDFGARLKKLGFENTPEAIKWAEKWEKHIGNQSQVKSYEELASLIKEYKQTYPFLKFLTENELDNICEKYGLIYAPVQNYTKSVPEKNLREIENAQSLKEDHRKDPELIIKVTDVYYDSKELKGKSFKISDKNVIDQYQKIGYDSGKWAIVNNYVSKNKETLGLIFGDDRPISSHKSELIDYNSSLFIAAPKSHFNLEGLKKHKKGFFNVTICEVKDPIVFRYVKGGIQVLTKWGLEANDESLVVDKLN